MIVSTEGSVTTYDGGGSSTYGGSSTSSGGTMSAPTGSGSDTTPSIPNSGGTLDGGGSYMPIPTANDPTDQGKTAGGQDTALRLVDLFAQAFGQAKVADRTSVAPLVLQSSPVASGGSLSLPGLAIMLVVAGGAFWLYKRHHKGG